MVPKLSETHGGVPYQEMPVKITNSSTSWVEFTVSQKWKDGTLSYFATEYQQENESWECKKVENNVPPGTTAGPYRAKCDEDGIATVTTIAHDGSFQHLSTEDISSRIANTACHQECSSDTGKKTMHVFKVPCDCVAAAALAAETDDMGHNCSVPVTCTQQVFENFEGGEAECWTNGLESVNGDSTQFLGRLGVNNDVVFRTFQVPEEAPKLILEFDFYDIGDRMPHDVFILQIENVELEFDFGISSPGQIGNFVFDIVNYSSKSHVNVTIPQSYYEDGQLYISFKVVADSSIDDDSYGVDNFKLRADCTSRRELDQEQYGWKGPVQEPSFHFDDDGYYCSAEDFPCEGEGEDTVYVCHYSARTGYQTFCIPEEDSEVLRFYKNDYCGPCVGGYGGVNMQ